MASSFILSIVILAAACSTWGYRIVGGDTTTIEQYPSIVQVEFRIGIFWAQSCGGNIITSRHVLSAAHCFTGLLYSPSNRRIRAGSTQRNNGGAIIRVSRTINHPSYNRRTFDSDISIIVLTRVLTYGPTIQPVSILRQGQQLPDNLPVVHAGWGAVASGGVASSLLRHVTVYSVDRDECRQRYASLSRPLVVTDNMICAGLLDVGGRDACQGDSGGPLYYNNNGTNIVVGIVSWGVDCAHPAYPGVNTAVSSYTDWIVTTATVV